ncbi:hypothetical protein O3G_MSEX012017 [Manduca sexta]|uniref:DUF4789 domain-containing protein n=1 Tax=Manduca sexta TaxID=7130 RepID=A0A921ZNK3_MANSE|nr:hypothetical protein O3G_MSEX012017 [Manduca sexta]
MFVLQVVLEFCVWRLFVAFLFVCSSIAKNTSDVIGFPESEENPDLKNKENRQPVFLPAMCPVNELFYPGDQKDDWICDCRPAHLYHPASDLCWPAFRQGPCPEGQYLTLPQDSPIPVCQNNPCAIDRQVQWNGKCEVLGNSAPCNHLFPTPAALGVNATTLVVSCVRLSFNNRFTERVTTSVCPPGCKRSINGKCPVIY